MAHAPAAVCTPSRYGVLTGRYPWRSRLKSSVLSTFSPPLIRHERTTIAEMLRDNGYYTGHIGKWHLGNGWQLKNGGDYEAAYAANRKNHNKFADPGVDFTKPLTDGPNQHGFDYSIAANITIVQNNELQGEVQVTAPNKKNGYRDPKLERVELVPLWVKKADEFIHKASQGEQPFFLYYALTAPHLPHVPTEQFIGKSGAGIYGDFVLECDWVVGELMASLKATGADENTLVFLTSDNGPENVTLELKNRYGHYSAGGLRGHKRLNFEGGHRVPTFAWWPGVVKPGSVCDATVSQVDFFATCADMVGHTLKDDEAVDSWSMLPALKGDPSFRRGESVIYQNYLGQLAIRQGDWVMMMHPAWKGMLSTYVDPEEPEILNAEPFQLYNLSEDSRERHQSLQGLSEKGGRDEGDGGRTCPEGPFKPRTSAGERSTLRIHRIVGSNRVGKMTIRRNPFFLYQSRCRTARLRFLRCIRTLPISIERKTTNGKYDSLDLYWVASVFGQPSIINGTC